MVRFDAYTATAEGVKPSDVVGWFFEDAGGASNLRVTMGRGFHTFGERLSLRDDTGQEVGAVAYGGRQGERIMFEVKGERTPGLVERLRRSAEHRCTRVDACADFDRPGAWEELLAPVLQVKEQHKLYGEKRGDWEFPELGRTQYLGANSSAVRARLYEKGRQPEYRHLERFDLCRLEIQVRPAKDAKTEYSKLGPLEVWGASKWTRELAATVLQEHVDPHPAGTVRRDTTRDRALRWMALQYGPHLVSLADDLGGWDVLGLTLGEMVRDERLRARRFRGLQS
jgi:hypothetical protein